MPVVRQILIVLLACGGSLMAACSPGAASIQYEQIVGSWYGERIEGGLPILWLSTYSSQGDFKVSFYHCEDAVVVGYSHHEGTGALDAFGRIVTRVSSIDASDESWQAESTDDEIVHTYRIARWGEMDMEYVHVDYGNRYRARRVDDAFLPACPANRAAAARRSSAQGNAWISLATLDDDDSSASSADTPAEGAQDSTNEDGDDGPTPLRD